MGTMAIAIINPIMAFFRPGKEAESRKFFNVAHGMLGRGARIISFIAVIYILSYLNGESFSRKGYAYGASVTLILISVIEFCFGMALWFTKWKSLNKILYVVYVAMIILG